MRFLVLAGAVLVSAATLTACDAFDTSRGEARMTVRLTDAPFPFDLADSANVSITRIELRASGDAAGDSTSSDSTEAGSGREVIVLFDAATDGGPLAFNLLDLRDGVTATLVDEFAFPADGGYDQLRIFVGDDASVVFTDGSVYALKLPSAQQSGLKVRLPAYEVDGEEDEVDVLIDFDVEESFVARGTPGTATFNGFIFKPVLKVESFQIVEVGDDSEDESDEEDSGEDGEG